MKRIITMMTILKCNKVILQDHMKDNLVIEITTILMKDTMILQNVLIETVIGQETDLRYSSILDLVEILIEMMIELLMITNEVKIEVIAMEINQLVGHTIVDLHIVEGLNQIINHLAINQKDMVKDLMIEMVMSIIKLSLPRL